MKRSLRMALGLAVVLADALAWGDSIELVRYAMNATGRTREDIVVSCTEGRGNSKTLPFDGTTFSRDGNFCWRGTISQGPYFQFYLFASIDFPRCIGYRVHRLSTGWWSRDRSPTAWTVSISSNKVDWTTIDERSGVVWEGNQTGQNIPGSDPDEADCMKEFMLSAPSVPFKYIRFTPTDSQRHATTGGEQNDVGLMEVEFLVDAESTSLIVNYGQQGILPYRGGAFSHPDGLSFSSSATVTAPSFAVDGSGRILACCGYRLEELVNGVWDNVQTVASRTFDYVPESNRALRLTWLWEQVGCVNVSLTEILQSLDVVPTYEGGIDGVDYASGLSPDKCFDGVCYTNVASYRWAGKRGSHVSILFPSESIQGGGVRLSSYRLWQHSAGYNCNERAPTAWRLEGTSDGLTWQLIDERRYWIWYSQEHLDTYGIGTAAKAPPEDRCSIEFAVDDSALYCGFRLTTLNSWPTMDGTDWPVGLMEIELRCGTELEQKTFSVVGGGASAAGMEILAPADVRANDVLSVSECKFDGGYALVSDGYRLERWNDSSHVWDMVEESSARTYTVPQDDMRGYRLTWRWHTAAVRAEVQIDAGVGELSFDPAMSAYTDADGGRYYVVGTEVALTAPAGATESPRSEFLGFAGDLAGAAIDGRTISFTVGATPRIIKARYRRHWQYYVDENAVGNQGRITDGNWIFQVRGYKNAIADYASYKTLSLTSPSHPDAEGRVPAYVQGGGRLDFTTFNDDMAEQADSDEWRGKTGPRPVLCLLDKTFTNLTELAEAVIPTNILSFGSEIFAGCPNLVSAEFLAKNTENAAPANSQRIFANCPKLETVVLANGGSVPQDAFRGCPGIKSLTVGAGYTEIMGEQLLDEGTHPDLVDLSQSAIVVIPKKCFMKVDFGRIVLPPTVDDMQGHAFCSSAEYLYSRLHEIVFLGGPPAQRSDNWSNDGYLEFSSTNYRYVLTITEEHQNEWVTNDGFKAKGTGAIENETLQPYYAEVSKPSKRYLGTWANKWLRLMPPKPGLLIIVR